MVWTGPLLYHQRISESHLPTQFTHHYSVFAFMLSCPLNHELVKVLFKSLFLFPQAVQCLTDTCVCVCVCVSRSVVSDSVTPWSVARQAPLSMEFSRQEYWSWLPFPSPGDLPDPGMEPRSPALQADSSLSEPPGKQQAFNRHIC